MASNGRGGEGNSVRRVVGVLFFGRYGDGHLRGGSVGIKEAVGVVGNGGVVVIVGKIGDGCSNLLREAL